MKFAREFIVNALVGGVIFVGLALGGFAPKAAPPALLGTLGLLFFLYGVGVQQIAAVLIGG